MDKELREKVTAEIWCCSINLEEFHKGLPASYLPKDFESQKLIDKSPYYEAAEKQDALYKEAGYVRLDPDQTLPVNPYKRHRRLRPREFDFEAAVTEGWSRALATAQRAHWRKVILEE